MNKLTVAEVFEGFPDKQALYYADAFLFSVYGWTPEKVHKMRLESVARWVKLAKKRMTVGDIYRMQRLIESKPERPLWKKILSRIGY